MKKQELRERFSLGTEGSLEYKKRYSKEAFGKVICSFLNTNGGYLVLLPDSETAEIHSLTFLRKEIEEWIQKDIIPRTPVFVNFDKTDSPSALIIEVPEGLNKPYSFQNVFYMRQGSMIHPADVYEIRSMLLNQQTTPTRWERVFSDEITADDFSPDELTALRKVIPFDDEKSFMEKMESLSLMRQERLTNAADILLTKNPAIRHPQTRVRAVCYSDKTDDNYRDYKIKEGPALFVLEEVLDFIRKNIPNRVEFSNHTLQRQDTPLYPMDAVREGLVNAFAHRDYASYSGGIRVEIGKDQMSIWNSGSLPKEVSMDSLKKGHVSVLRNPDIANYFRIRGYMETLGRGSLLIINSCKKAGLPPPKWESDASGVTLTFSAGRYSLETKILTDLSVGEIVKRVSELMPKMPTVPSAGEIAKRVFELGAKMPTGLSAGEIAKLVFEQIQKERHKNELNNWPENGPENGPDLNTSEKEIIRLLDVSNCSKAELVKQMGLKSVSGGLKRAIKHLWEMGLIQWTIPGNPRSRYQKYALTDNGKQYAKGLKQ